MAHVSIGEQKLLLEILEQGNISSHTQKSFDSKKFFVAINCLIENGLVKKSENWYQLTLNGEIFSLMIRDYKRA